MRKINNLELLGEIGVAHANPHRELLLAFRSGKITNEDLRIQIAGEIYDMREQYSFKPYPSTPPDILAYGNADMKSRDEMNRAKILEKSENREYFDRLSKIQGENLRDLFSLKSARDVLRDAGGYDLCVNNLNQQIQSFESKYYASDKSLRVDYTCQI